MATKPTVATEWATQFTNAGVSGNPNKEEPTQSFKDFGQPEALPVDRQSLNYNLNALDLWKIYFEEITDEILADISGLGIFTVISSNSVLEVGSENFIITTSGDVDVSLPSTTNVSEGDTLTVKHSFGSTNVCKIVNTGYTIKGLGGYNATSSDDLILDAGDIVRLVAVDNTTLELQGDS